MLVVTGPLGFGDGHAGAFEPLRKAALPLADVGLLGEQEGPQAGGCGPSWSSSLIPDWSWRMAADGRPRYSLRRWARRYAICARGSGSPCAAIEASRYASSARWYSPSSSSVRPRSPNTAASSWLSTSPSRRAGGDGPLEVDHHLTAACASLGRIRRHPCVPPRPFPVLGGQEVERQIGATTLSVARVASPARRPTRGAGPAAGGTAGSDRPLLGAARGGSGSSGRPLP